MYLENEKYSIDISMDDTYTLESADNPFSYKVVFNPDNYRKNDFYKVMSVKVNDGINETNFAVIGDGVFTYPYSCAVLNGDILTLLLNEYLMFIDISNFTMKEYRNIGFDCNFSIDPCKYGYLIYGELSILFLDFDFNVKWHFSGCDIFVSCSGKIPFAFDDQKIMLYDWCDNYYELDYDGNLLNR
ncbi:MAG: hypothetical protein II931_06615 [Clostridia bacterium]|nr:hypothetical protein [Clostridia bacterium]